MLFRSVASQLGAGKVRVVAVSSPKRLGGQLASVPTWKEQGADSTFSSSRGVIGPKGMSAAQIAYWESVLARVVESDDWKKEIETNFWDSQFLGSADTRKMLKSQYDEYKSVLVDVGLAR